MHIYVSFLYEGDLRTCPLALAVGSIPIKGELLNVLDASLEPRTLEYHMGAHCFVERANLSVMTHPQKTDQD